MAIQGFDLFGSKREGSLHNGFTYAFVSSKLSLV